MSAAVAMKAVDAQHSAGQYSAVLSPALGGYRRQSNSLFLDLERRHHHDPVLQFTELI